MPRSSKSTSPETTAPAAPPSAVDAPKRRRKATAGEDAAPKKPRKPRKVSALPVIELVHGQRAALPFLPHKSPAPPVVAAVASETLPALKSVLLVLADLGAARMISDTLESKRLCRVERTTSSLAAYELAMQRPFDLFVFALTMPTLSGPLLFELLQIAFRFTHGGRRLPQVIFLCPAEEIARHEELRRDARVRGLLATPINLGRLDELVHGVLPPRPDLNLSPPS